MRLHLRDGTTVILRPLIKEDSGALATLPQWLKMDERSEVKLQTHVHLLRDAIILTAIIA